VKCLWDHYVTNKKSERHPDAAEYSSTSLAPPPTCTTCQLQSSTLAAPPAGTKFVSHVARENILPTLARGTELSNNSADDSSEDISDALAESELQANEVLSRIKFASKPLSVASGRVELPTRDATHIIEIPDLGRLHIPKEGPFKCATWFDTSINSTPKLKIRSAANIIKFPVFMPTHKRSDIGLLDLRKAMRVPGPACAPEIINVEYLQILVVKPGEFKAYSSKFPYMVIYELPEHTLVKGVWHSTQQLGIGQARFCIQRLAEIICPDDMLGSDGAGRYCFVLDDSQKSWLGLTLPNDPEPQFGQEPTQKMQWQEVSLAKVLLYLQDKDFADRHKFAAIGFHRKGFGLIKTAYARAHIYSAVLLNLDVLKKAQVEFDPELKIWEDLDFNRRASEKQLVLCKCRRFQQVVESFARGGCSNTVAKGAGVMVKCTVVSPGCEGTFGEVKTYLSRAIDIASHREVVCARLKKNVCSKLSKPEAEPPVTVVPGMVEKTVVTHVDGKAEPAPGVAIEVFQFPEDLGWSAVQTLQVKMILKSGTNSLAQDVFTSDEAAADLDDDVDALQNEIEKHYAEIAKLQKRQSAVRAKAKERDLAAADRNLEEKNEAIRKLAAELKHDPARAGEMAEKADAMKTATEARELAFKALQEFKDAL
jgi:hypothetical protein